jgi:hypothetical protein
VRIYYEILEFFGGLDLFDLRRVCFVGLAEEAPPILIYHGGGWGRSMKLSRKSRFLRKTTFLSGETTGRAVGTRGCVWAEETACGGGGPTRQCM